MMSISDESSIVCSTMKDNETWYTCPTCGISWKDEVSIPRILYMVKPCSRCEDITMTRKELEQVLLCLKKIGQPNEHVNEAIASVERDIARRKQQSKDQLDQMSKVEWPFGC